MQSKILDIIKSGILFDSHSHFSDIDLNQDGIIQDCKVNGIQYIVDVSTDSKSLKKVLESKKKLKDEILFSVGVHPEIFIPYANPENDGGIETCLNIEDEIREFKKYFEGDPILPDLIGECGLDYYQLDRIGLSPAEKSQNIERQKDLFILHLEIAKSKKLPITIHSRGAESDALRILEEYVGKIPLIILHSFTGSIEEAQKAREMGVYLGINGIITYKSAENIRDIVKYFFKDKKLESVKDLYENGFLLETDSPLLMPRNIKTKETQNTPGKIKYIWEFVYNLINEEKDTKTHI